jgi:hypothetical protein
MNNDTIFAGRNIVIATKHKKEKVIAPILEKELGLTAFTIEDLDTDLFGTFTGEVDRENDPLETARAKCLRAMQLANCDLAIASEGSFGPHPNLVFAHADDEILLLIDKKNDLEIFIRVLTTETNFNAATITTKQELKDFAIKTKFSSHALILKKSKDDFSEMVKGITDWEVLSATFKKFISSNGSAYVETDMRAMNNPTRMQTIEKATHKLVAKIKNCCPTCLTPGLGITAIKEGLLCSLCNKPTKSILSHLYECQKCDFVKEEKYPNQKETEEPMYCDYCNP